MARVSRALRKGQQMVYQAWELHQFVEWKGQQEPVV